MAGNSGGPWGGGGNSGGGRQQPPSGGGGGGRRPDGDKPQIPDIEDLMRKGQDQLRVLMGGRGNGGGWHGPGPSVEATNCRRQARRVPDYR